MDGEKLNNSFKIALEFPATSGGSVRPYREGFGRYFFGKGDVMEEQKPRIIKDDHLHPVYLNQYGRETETYREHIEDYLLTPINHMDQLVGILGDDAFEEFGFICQALIDLGRAKVQKACELIEGAVGGEVYVDTPMRSEITYDGGLPIGAVCRPGDQDK